MQPRLPFSPEAGAKSADDFESVIKDFEFEDVTYSEISDEELIDRLRQGESQITDYIMFKYKNLVRKKARSMYILGADNDDLIQEGMIGLFKAVRDYDIGRDAIERVYAEVFRCEDALVRGSILSGTVALATLLYGILRPGDEIVAVTGKPYDTLEEVIGIREGSSGSLKDFGVSYRQVDMINSKVNELVSRTTDSYEMSWEKMNLAETEENIKMKY